MIANGNHKSNTTHICMQKPRIHKNFTVGQQAEIDFLGLVKN